MTAGPVHALVTRIERRIVSRSSVGIGLLVMGTDRLRSHQISPSLLTINIEDILGDAAEEHQTNCDCLGCPCAKFVLIRSID